MDQALVYRSYTCGPLCGAGELVFLVKEDGTWKILKTIDLWIS